MTKHGFGYSYFIKNMMFEDIQKNLDGKSVGSVILVASAGIKVKNLT
jgi:hypothetical protein